MNIDAEKLSATVAKLLKERRLKAGLSHERVAELAGIHRSTISRVEANQIKGTLFVFQSIANALQISLSSILADAENLLREE